MLIARGLEFLARDLLRANLRQPSIVTKVRRDRKRSSAQAVVRVIC